MNRYTIVTNNSSRLVLEATNPQEAAIRAVLRLQLLGAKPQDLSYVDPTLPAGYELHIAEEGEVTAERPFRIRVYVGFKDQTGGFSPCCGGPGTVAFYLGDAMIELTPGEPVHQAVAY